MKISVNDSELFTLTETQKKIICNDIPAGIFEEDMKRRLQWVLMHKYEQCFKRLYDEWVPKLSVNGVEMIPTDKEAFASLVFEQPDYKDRSARDAESEI